MNPRALVFALALLAWAGTAVAETRDLSLDIEACPGGRAWMEAEQARAMRAYGETHGATAPTDPDLRRELLLMRDADQAPRQARLHAGTTPPDTSAVDARNLARLKVIIDRHGFPTVAAVGSDGVAAAWLLVQHADTDPPFQSRMLETIASRSEAEGISRQQIALLTDQVRLASGRHQLYGTKVQRNPDTGAFEYVGGLENPAGLNGRRAAMGLMPAETDRCLRERVGLH